MTIERSESHNQHAGYKPANAYDGSYDTWYCPKDNAVDGNYLKLYLSQANFIRLVKMANRGSDIYEQDRIVNTELRVYSTGNGETETEVASCGKITGREYEI